MSHACPLLGCPCASKSLLAMPQGNNPARGSHGSPGPPLLAWGPPATSFPSRSRCHRSSPTHLHPPGSGTGWRMIWEGSCRGLWDPVGTNVATAGRPEPGFSPWSRGVSQVPSPNCSRFPARRRPRRAAAPTTASAAPRAPPAPPAAWPDRPGPPRARPAPGCRTGGLASTTLSWFFAPNLRPSPEGASVTHSVNALAPRGQPTLGGGAPCNPPGVPYCWVHQGGAERAAIARAPPKAPHQMGKGTGKSGCPQDVPQQLG